MNDSLLHIAQMKLTNGHITSYDYRQVEMQTLEIEYTYQNALKLSETANLRLKTFLNIDSEKLLIAKPEFDMPPIIDYDDVAYYTKQNNPFLMEQQVKQIEAEKQLLSSLLSTTFNGTLSIHYGINQYAESLINAYRHPDKQQSISIGFQIPIFQWGINRNKRRIAKNTYQAGLLDMENSIRKFHNEIKEGVSNYNHAVNLWKLSDRSYQLQQDQYRMAIRSFELGNISVYELISAFKKQDEALHQYHSAIKEAYTSYFSLRHIALYDFKQGKSLEDILISTQ